MNVLRQTHWPVVIRAAAILFGFYLAYYLLVSRLGYLPELPTDPTRSLSSGLLWKIRVINFYIPSAACCVAGYAAGRMSRGAELRHAFFTAVIALLLWALALTIWHQIGLFHSPPSFTLFIIKFLAPTATLAAVAGGAAAKLQFRTKGAA